ncbi:MAG: GAF domain-containing protein [Alphaproteobacteria bacterium]|nr:GAF domain-containing protein [Alphaproteobacteria bacterium]MBT5860270.1 GAF domain-containing protein [Alphaproteobacteria bacterium]
MREMETLLSISRTVAAMETVDEVLRTLVEIVTQETQSERGSLFLNDDQTGELYSRVALGDHMREIRILNSSGIAGQAFTAGEGLMIHDAHADPRFNAEVDEQTGFVTRNILCAPIRTVGGEVIGVVQALNKKKGRFTKRDMSFLEAMTTQAATALQSTQRLENMARDRATEMQFLDVVSDVTAEIDLGALLQKVMSEATSMLKAERSTLFLSDEKTNELFSRVAQGDSLGEIRLPNHLGIAGAVFTSGHTINIPHAYADLRFNPAFDKQTGFFTRSMLCVPVINKKGKVIGVTQVLNKRGGPFNSEDESRLKAFTAQVSIALENAKLFDDVQTMKNYNESMLESMSNGVITMDDEGVIVTCNTAGLRILNVAEDAIIGASAKEFFAGANEWILEKIDSVSESQEQEIFMDADVEVAGEDEDAPGEKVSANITILPLVNETDQQKKLGSLLMIEDISSEKRMKSTMSRYMDPGIAEQMLAAGEDVMGGTESVATVLFSDVRSFTTLTEQLGPQGTVSLLNEYFTLMVDCIQEEDGMLDKFIGDAIMAAFGIPVDHGDDEDRAVRAALKMLVDLREWNDKREAAGQMRVEMGVGLNTDHVVSGNIGSPKRMDFTLIGDGVNLAARLESACKQYSAKLLISEFTYAKLKGTYRSREIDYVIVKGKTEPVGVIELLDYHTEESFPNLMDAVNYFREGIKEFRQGNWDKSIGRFKEVLDANPNDALSHTYIERNQTMKKKNPKDWNGVWVMTSK